MLEEKVKVLLSTIKAVFNIGDDEDITSFNIVYKDGVLVDAEVKVTRTIKPINQPRKEVKVISKVKRTVLHAKPSKKGLRETYEDTPEDFLKIKVWLNYLRTRNAITDSELTELVEFGGKRFDQLDVDARRKLYTIFNNVKSRYIEKAACVMEDKEDDDRV